MQNKIRKKEGAKTRIVVRQVIQQEPSQLGQSASLIYLPTRAKIPVEIREILFIKDTDLGALRKDFEEFCQKWD